MDFSERKMQDYEIRQFMKEKEIFEFVRGKKQREYIILAVKLTDEKRSKTCDGDVYNTISERLGTNYSNTAGSLSQIFKTLKCGNADFEAGKFAYLVGAKGARLSSSIERLSYACRRWCEEKWKKEAGLKVGSDDEESKVLTSETVSSEIEKKIVETVNMVLAEKFRQFAECLEGEKNNG